ncbi:hypothetical protein PMKS-002332 [Pichia membranifaciens]|uniref:Uncharacterized protein n=1 Tax=Pichia membranifaciens TaxID=4926 RepID=A0A1Q2YH85_9ASCO|nr:hypothetical protein PMKS-002332 [Pichia membranifaciens]
MCLLSSASTRMQCLKEFTYRMKIFLGGYDAEKALKDMPEDEETKQITDSLDSILNGNLLDAFDDKETKKESASSK